MTLDELLAKLPDNLKEKGQIFGPVVVQMTAQQIQDWLNYVFVGRYTDAYRIYLKAVGMDDLLTEWDKENAAWKKDNEANAAQIAMSNKIALAVCQVMLGVVLAAVGL